MALAMVTPADRALSVLYLRPAELPAMAGLLDTRGLGAVGFARDRPVGLPRSLPQAGITAPPIHPDEPLVEIWMSTHPTTGGQTGAIAWRCDGQHLFGMLQADAGADIRGVTEQAYAAVCRLLDQEGYPHLVRVWNYFPAINREEAGLERYRQFNIGRQDAFLRANRPIAGALPAACALGTPTGPLTVYFIASRTAAIPIENPRQLSAYLYPGEYGPRSPSFSRATLLRSEGQTTVFVSGTASIVGHESLHPGDAAAQTRETLANIAALVFALNREPHGAGFTLADFRYKAYVRPGCALEPIQWELASALPAAAEVLFLQADICRHELLVEIEAFGSRSP
ncbi:chorismate transformation enzyme, FkbO/Hyg5 family [Methylococcus geothermalis]|uniref:Chorismatase FkbO/Hyg5-like N-terminal domain-containing protein n=1 Tax=Methylococcus geothermalis TaxID=2681310 RepID=A0A858Q8J9_9GAMM|nr:hypothetical protein [Methylococcus geothermalis]QJD30125.1 hypothetical protein GNH96_09190 [Methylococcus geothermalis]